MRPDERDEMNDTEAIMALAMDYRDAPNAQAGAAYKTLRTAIDDLLAELGQRLDDARSEATALRINKQNLEARLQQVREWIAERPEGRTVSAGKMVAMLTEVMEAPQPAAEPAQREWIGLTDEDLRDLFTQARAFDRLEKFSRIIEAKLREKNGSKP